MLRPAHLFSTALLAAVAIPLLNDMQTGGHTTDLQPSHMTTPRASVAPSTISISAPSKPVQPQRWVF